ncbi:DEAD/DEAH box helicase family protein [Vibrio parahaemolyticus]|nr:DEAD/DEAH box helicase family protein [Vibrio parahaemolyticus]
MLRGWQRESVQTALRKYRAGESHFQVQATPGAGKTVMAAEVAKQLLDANEIDLVLCFSPSTAIAQGIKSTFAWKLNCAFSGGLGALGASFTYQSMKYLPDSFWCTLKKYRVLAVFDEIHHCSGDEVQQANVWGKQILTKIQGIAKYTLGLSGTPWRSDLMPITLAEYVGADGYIKCDYKYSLKQAIEDRVCRAPNIVLIDNEHLSISNGTDSKSFSSIHELLSQTSTSYQSILNNRDAMLYLLGLACQKLKEIRAESPKAGGVVVASSVSHAIEIQSLLSEILNQSTLIVTYHHDNPLGTIEQFRNGDTQWIISVGMISEGTDIPRLQVCCHLSSVKTELYFRQVLGRVLRVNDAKNQAAWLYTFAEENLIAFAEQVEKDIPNTCLFIKASEDGAQELSFPEKKNDTKGKSFGQVKHKPTLLWQGSTEPKNLAATPTLPPSYNELKLGQFRERVIAAFL